MPQELYLDPTHRKIGGVCAGVARYLDVPRFWVRIAAVIGLFIHAPSVLIAYGLAYMILDDAPETYDEVIPREEFTD
ncbi:MAG: PspC domain-containing protein [Pseudomonadales bacterium]|nr:PspC domain-containing protein [Pseudomonadales bacterium]